MPFFWWRRDASTVVARQEVEMKFVQKTNASIAEQVQLIKKKAPKDWYLSVRFWSIKVKGDENFGRFAGPQKQIMECCFSPSN